MKLVENLKLIQTI